MNPLVFWNELAELPLAADAASGGARMDEFVDALAAVSRAATGLPQPRLCTHAPLDGIELAAGFTVATWSVGADQARRVFVRKLAASSPIERGLEGGARDDYECSECRVHGDPALGFRGAHVAGDLATSLRSHHHWDTAEVTVVVDRLDEDAKLQTETAVVRHVATVAHVEVHRAWLTERLRRAVANGGDLVARAASLCPHLELGRDVQAELRQIDAGDRLRNVLRILFALEDAFAAWKGSPIQPGFIAAKCTSNTPLPFLRADGTSHEFKWHVRYTSPGGAGRVFFDGDHDKLRGIVGFIGLKKDV